MKALYVSHFARPCYELEWLSQLPVDELKILDVDFSNYPKDPPSHVRYCQVKHTALPSLHSTAKIVFYSDYKKYVKDVDVVIVLEAFSSLSYQFIRYCKSIGKPVVMLVYELIASHPIYKLFPYSFFTKKNLQHATKFVSITDTAKQHLKSLCVDETKIKTISPGIDTAMFRPERQKTSNQDIIFVGKLELHKGIDAVLDTYFKSVKPYAHRKMTIVGDGSYRDKIEELIANGERIDYYPFVQHDKIADALRKHSVFIMPARDTFRLGQKIGAEQFCFAIVEAMACGLAIVSTDCGAIPEVVGEDNFLCPQKDVKNFSKYVDKALSKLHTRIGAKNSSRVVKNYNQQIQAQRLHQLLSDVATP